MYKDPGVLETLARQEWEWFKIFGNDSALFPLHEVIKIKTARYGINHKRYFNVVWGYIEEFWLDSVVAEVGVFEAGRLWSKVGLL